MGLKRRRFSREFKLHVVHEIEGGKLIAQLAREYQLSPNMVLRWKQEHRKNAEEAFQGNGNLYKQEARIAELERLCGQLTMENAFLKKALLRLEALDQPKKGRN